MLRMATAKAGRGFRGLTLGGVGVSFGNTDEGLVA